MKFNVNLKDKTFLKAEAKDFLANFYQSKALNGFKERWRIVEKNIINSNTYCHTPEELAFGARLAWRNSNRCIGRLFWKTLKVIDCRTVDTKQAFVQSLQTHLKTAQATKKIRSTISIFPPQTDFEETPFRILNYTLLQYAGYQSENGPIVGDPMHLSFTKYCQNLGWNGKKTAFDILPVVIRDKNGEDDYIELQKNIIKEVQITHPELPFFADLNLQWYALPIISNMKLEIGGITYPTAPFNGWYMLNEIATRNLGDSKRYNLLPIIATKMGLDKQLPFWKDKALIAINEAVYHSFNKAGVTIVDHHTAVEQFMKFTRMEIANNRKVTGEWSWLIPPNAPSTTEVFHQEFDNTIKKPNFFENSYL